MANRRAFLVGVTGAALGVGVGGLAHAGRDEDDVSPTEDLMREHGIVRRILLIYDEVLRRAVAGDAMPVDPVARAAHVVRTFIEDYHEADEEQFIFPCCQAAGQSVALVDVLIRQHRAGRALTAEIQRAATPTRWNEAVTRHAATDAMKRFVRMYTAHAAFEDTVLFPTFSRVIGERTMKRVQQRFEEIERALPNGDFEKTLAEVADIERALDIADLDRYTPLLDKTADNARGR